MINSVFHSTSKKEELQLILKNGQEDRYIQIVSFEIQTTKCVPCFMVIDQCPDPVLL